MTTKLAAAVAIAHAAAAIALVNNGSKLQVYDGAMPATADTALGAQVKLVEFALPNPAFQAPVDTVGGAVATGNAVTAANAIATGTATWGRIVNAAGNPLWIGDVTNTAGTGAIKISSTNITNGIEISVISHSYVQPKE